jgi:ribosome recycling factor
MKRSVISQYDQLKGRMEGYAAMLYYRYANLCIKADELSLLPIVIVIEGETKKFEDVANVAKDGEYAFKIFPKYDDDLEAVSMGITHEHPEFKQERKTLEVQTEDGKNVEIPYLLVTMPPVDNDRHDVLKQGADALYQECKAQMEAAKTQAEAEIAMLMAGESKDAIDNVNDAVKELIKTWTEKRDQLHDQKLKEIDDALAHYLQGKQQEEQERHESEEAAGDGGNSLDLSKMAE